MPKIDIILQRLDMVKPSGKNRFMARCPAHDDKSPSLLITEDDEKVSIHCFAGCGGADVLAAIGMQFADLYPDTIARDYSKGLPDWKLRDLNNELKEHKFNVSAAKEWAKKGEKIDDDFKLAVLNSIEKIKEITKRLAENA